MKVSSNKEIKLRCEKTDEVVQNYVAFVNHIMLNRDEDFKKKQNTLDHVTCTPTLSNFCITTLG